MRHAIKVANAIYVPTIALATATVIWTVVLIIHSNWGW